LHGFASPAAPPIEELGMASCAGSKLGQACAKVTNMSEKTTPTTVNFEIRFIKLAIPCSIKS
jgi:hypothetical protein